MFKKYFFLIVFLLFDSPIISESTSSLDNMKIMDSQTTYNTASTSHDESRNSQWKKYLSASVKIAIPLENNMEGSGSGTIIYYDKEKNLAYVATCGHLWKGIKYADDTTKLNCKIIVWYHNSKKLSAPRTYIGNVVFYTSNKYDTGLVTFKPDWQPDYFPIASVDYVYKKNKILHSLGCDGGRETAHYSVSIIGVDSNNSLVTINNSPRPGRSGGGVIDNDYYVATCWGTQFENGSGKGYFTTLKSIYSFWTKNGYGFLLNRKKNIVAQNLKIVDKNTKQLKYSSEYILIP